ncbi:hypothetical protein HB816_12990 [Listeria booriae]|uniref:T7SS effector LXG polymorphic toxin n=1 Tax=Listeria booriae TaxID=1552123 RepID=UPI00162A9475|nr:T7SS effector LXG polymorphic toxin [Listeria booriae]MBC1231372.1 hypothetical protein [Listeria booriae]
MTRIDIAEVTHFRSQLRATNQEITPRIEAVKQAVTDYLNDGSITGEAIQASKEYYAGAYIQLCGSMKQALKMSEDKLQQYIQDFHSQVDPSHNARLDADGIYDLNQKINGFENRMESLTAEISAINGTQKASELNYLATQIFEAHKKEEILAKYLDFERSHANFFNELGELAHYIKQALQDIQKNIRFDRVTGTYGVDKLNRTNFKELSRLYASQQAIDDKIKEIEDIGLTPVIPNGNSAGFMMNDGQLNTTATLGFVNEQMIYWQNESTFRELFLVGSSYRVFYGIDAVTGQHVTDSRLAFDLLVLASSAFGVSSFATRFGAVKTASFDKNVVLKNIEASKAARESSNFDIYLKNEEAVLKNVAEDSKTIKGNNLEVIGNAKNHLKNVENITAKKGIVGGHNLNEFNKALKSQGFNSGDLIVSKKPHPFIKGVYEIEYKIPRKDMAGNVAEPVSYKNIKEPKTVYDPSIISDEKMYQWGQEAMQSGVISGRLVEGSASNGLKFRGYLNESGKITNFFPIID